MVLLFILNVKRENKITALLHGTFALRMCVINYKTTWNDVRETLEAISKFGTESLTRAD